MLNTSGKKIRFMAYGAIIGPIIFTIVVFSLARAEEASSECARALGQRTQQHQD
jgi:hypothetical protein